MTKKAIYIFLFLFLAAGVQQAVSQITISPIFLFLDQQQRFGTLMVMNGSDQPQEVSLTFPFGYPVTTENGNIEMVYNDSTMAEKWGISEAIRAFPKNFTLQPGQRQVVRLTIRPRDFHDGMYWSRIKTTSIPASPPIGEAEGDQVTTRITYKFEQVTTVFYKHGNVNTGLKIEDITTKQTDEQFHYIADLKRSGNAPFLGTIRLSVVNEKGNIVLEKSMSTSIYFDYRQVFSIDKEKLSNGNYTARLQLVSQRGDIAPSDIVQMQTITRNTKFSVQ